MWGKSNFSIMYIGHLVINFNVQELANGYWYIYTYNIYI